MMGANTTWELNGHHWRRAAMNEHVYKTIEITGSPHKGPEAVSRALGDRELSEHRYVKQQNRDNAPKLTMDASSSMRLRMARAVASEIAAAASIPT
jgi:hypothetical protein